ncbi:MAG: HD domain-containing phosphohydrolase [Lachnospiraceae bacterium]
MKLYFSDILYAFSDGLDCVESQLLPIARGHGKRVAGFCVIMGRILEMKEEELLELAGLATLHDNALTEYIREEYNQGKDPGKGFEGKGLKAHCIMGEHNLEKLPFSSGARDAVLYHHEEADGSGPFEKTAEQTPLTAQLIHMGDTLDTRFRLDGITQEKYEKIRAYVKENENIRYSSICVQAFLNGTTAESFSKMNEDNLEKYLKEEVDSGLCEYSNKTIHDICDFWIKIIDYKSEFTRKHSLGVAMRAEDMGRYYGYNEDECTLLYLAGAVHDLGKLTVDSKILEKPDKLTEQEFKNIQNHAWQSWQMLKRIRGLETVTKWAVHHHEKLDGTGYPFGKGKEELSFEERLMACVDIYQALTEPRPYKDGFSHEKALAIMGEMVEKHFIDARITEDIGVKYGGV